MNNKNEVFEYLIDQLRQQVINNPYNQQCEDPAHEVLSLKNQLRDASALVAELQKALNLLGKQMSEQSGCRKEDTQECEHEWFWYDGARSAVCNKCGAKK